MGPRGHCSVTFPGLKEKDGAVVVEDPEVEEAIGVW